MDLYPIILAGGSGTRLWPLSRELYPKQFMPLTGRETMLQQTLRRLEGLPGLQSPLFVCNEAHRFIVSEQVRELGLRPRAIVLEPEGKNTAPALTLAALVLRDQLGGGEDPVLLVLPADHVIQDHEAFRRTVEAGARLARRGYLVTFGVVPSAPVTGYGYIHRGGPVDSDGAGSQAYRVAAFVEKPDLETARAFVASGEHFWNSGMFVFRASAWLKELERYRHDIAEACRRACEGLSRDGDFYRPDAEAFSACPAESIDYAVMEPASGRDGDSDCVVLPLDAGWSDLGAWSALWEVGQQDGDGNVVQGDVYAQGMRNSLLLSHHRLVAAVGLEDVIVVETADAVLVVHKDKVQEVREIVARLKAEGREEQANHRKVHRPWGSYETVDAGPRFQVKRLTVNPGASLSLQMHHHRAEHWVVVKGTAKVVRGDEEFLLTENQSAYVPVGMPHRLENPGTIPLEIIEVQSGSYLGEDDIVRFHDAYNRHLEATGRGVKAPPEPEVTPDGVDQNHA